MKKLLLILILTMSFSSYAQDNGRKERIKALKIAFITERLQLTEREAQKFWPIYNAFETENRKLRKQLSTRNIKKNVEELTDKEAESMLYEMMFIDDNRHKLKHQFSKDLLDILPAKKIILLKATEDDFNRRMMEQFKKRREGFKKDHP